MSTSTRKRSPLTRERLWQNDGRRTLATSSASSFFDLLARLFKPSAPPTPSEGVTPAPSKAHKVMVILHGAGDFPDDYYKPLVAEIEKRLGKPFDYIAAYYADVTNPRVASLVAEPESPEAAQFKAAFQKELERDYNAIPPNDRPASITSFTLPGPIDVLACVSKEVTQYLFTPRVTREIQARLIAALDDAVARFDDIVFVSHSLGTVVAFDVLKQHGERYNKISYWFTLGCPLAKLRRVGIRDADLGAITLQTIAHWHNIYDTTDIVANAIGPAFPNPGYRLHDIYVDVHRDPVKSHDYMNNAETLDLIANAMREA